MFNINNLQVIVPHRGVNEGKSRLASEFTPVARAKLNRWLLAHTLQVVTSWLKAPQRCTVVSPCEVTLALARKAGVAVLPELEPSTGLNAALSHAAAAATTQGAEQLLILPSDLPCLDLHALEAMCALAALAATGKATVIAPDRHRTGTNALWVDARVREFAFGSDSYARHVAQSVARNQRVQHCRHAGLAFDLDTAEDFAQWKQRANVPHAFLATLPQTEKHAAVVVSSRTK